MEDMTKEKKELLCQRLYELPLDSWYWYSSVPNSETVAIETRSRQRGVIAKVESGHLSLTIDGHEFLREPWEELGRLRNLYIAIQNYLAYQKSTKCSAQERILDKFLEGE